MAKNDPCWDGYKQVGWKMKNGKRVPNCVPTENALVFKQADRVLSTREQARIIRREALALLEKANEFSSTSRRVSKRAAYKVISRSLYSTRGLPFSIRKHQAISELSDYISLAKYNKVNGLTAFNTDLLPVSHPRSTKVTTMTASAILEAQMRWVVDDPRIKDENAKALIASAMMSHPDSPEHIYSMKRIELLPQGTVPLEALVAAYGDGNSRAAKSARAKLQRRDRKGRFAEMFGTFKLILGLRDGGKASATGRILGQNIFSPDLLDMELSDGRVVAVPISQGEQPDAFLDDNSEEARRSGYVRASDLDVDPNAPVVAEDNLVVMDAPSGFREDKDHRGPGRKFTDEAFDVTVFDKPSPETRDIIDAAIKRSRDMDLDDPVQIKKGEDGKIWDADRKIFAVNKRGEKTQFAFAQTWKDAVEQIARKEKLDAEQEQFQQGEEEEDTPLADQLKGAPKKAKQKKKEEKPKATIDGFKYNVPERSLDLDPNFNYVPEGDQDDPATLGAVFRPDELEDALVDALEPVDAQNPATGLGRLEDENGDEFEVPAEAILSAIGEQGGDPEMALAKAYDAINGNNENEKALTDARSKGRKEKAAEPKELDEVFDEVVSAEPETPAEEVVSAEEVDAEEELSPRENALSNLDYIPALSGLSQEEKESIVDNNGDYSPFIPANEDIDFPEGMYKPQESSPSDKEAALTLARNNFSETDLLKGLQEAVAGDGTSPVLRLDENGEFVPEPLKAEVWRDALALKGGDANKALRDIANGTLDIAKEEKAAKAKEQKRIKDAKKKRDKQYNDLLKKLGIENQKGSWNENDILRPMQRAFDKYGNDPAYKDDLDGLLEAYKSFLDGRNLDSYDDAEAALKEFKEAVDSTTADDEKYQNIVDTVSEAIADSLESIAGWRERNPEAGGDKSKNEISKKRPETLPEGWEAGDDDGRGTLMVHKGTGDVIDLVDRKGVEPYWFIASDAGESPDFDSPEEALKFWDDNFKDVERVYPEGVSVGESQAEDAAEEKGEEGPTDEIVTPPTVPPTETPETEEEEPKRVITYKRAGRRTLLRAGKGGAFRDKEIADFLAENGFEWSDTVERDGKTINVKAMTALQDDEEFRAFGKELRDRFGIDLQPRAETPTSPAQEPVDFDAPAPTPEPTPEIAPEAPEAETPKIDIKKPVLFDARNDSVNKNQRIIINDNKVFDLESRKFIRNIPEGMSEDDFLDEYFYRAARTDRNNETIANVISPDNLMRPEGFVEDPRELEDLREEVKRAEEQEVEEAGTPPNGPSKKLIEALLRRLSASHIVVGKGRFDYFDTDNPEDRAFLDMLDDKSPSEEMELVYEEARRLGLEIPEREFIGPVELSPEDIQFIQDRAARPISKELEPKPTESPRNGFFTVSPGGDWIFSEVTRDWQLSTQGSIKRGLVPLGEERAGEKLTEEDRQRLIEQYSKSVEDLVRAVGIIPGKDRDGNPLWDMFQADRHRAIRDLLMDLDIDGITSSDRYNSDADKDAEDVINEALVNATKDEKAYDIAGLIRNYNNKRAKADGALANPYNLNRKEMISRIMWFKWGAGFVKNESSYIRNAMKQFERDLDKLSNEELVKILDLYYDEMDLRLAEQRAAEERAEKIRQAREKKRREREQKLIDSLEEKDEEEKPKEKKKKSEEQKPSTSETTPTEEKPTPSTPEAAPTTPSLPDDYEEDTPDGYVYTDKSDQEVKKGDEIEVPGVGWVVVDRVFLPPVPGRNGVAFYKDENGNEVPFNLNNRVQTRAKQLPPEQRNLKTPTKLRIGEEVYLKDKDDYGPGWVTITNIKRVENPSDKAGKKPQVTWYIFYKDENGETQVWGYNYWSSSAWGGNGHTGKFPTRRPQPAAEEAPAEAPTGAKPTKASVRGADLKPGDVTVKDHFTITNVEGGYTKRVKGQDVPASRITGYYPGSVEQSSKLWADDTEFDVYRNVEPPAKGDLPELRQPRREDFVGDPAGFQEARNKYDEELERRKATWDVPEVTEAPKAVIVSDIPKNLQPNDIAFVEDKNTKKMDEFFVIVEVLPGTQDYVRPDNGEVEKKTIVRGFYPGHQIQEVDWNEDASISVIRGEAPENMPKPGDKDPIERIKNGTLKGAEYAKKRAEITALRKEASKDFKPSVEPEIVVTREPSRPVRPAFLGSAQELAKLGDGAAIAKALEGKRVVVFDFESIGNGEFNYDDPEAPIQIAGIIFENGEKVDEINLIMNPGVPLDKYYYENEDKNGKLDEAKLLDYEGQRVDDEFLAKQPSIKEQLQKFADFVGKDAIWVAHNAEFDTKMFEIWAKKLGVDFEMPGIIDTKAISKSNGNKANSLKALIKKYKIEVNSEDLHDALVDSAALKQVLDKLLLDMKPDNIEFDLKARADLYEAQMERYRKEMEVWNAQQVKAKPNLDESGTDDKPENYIHKSIFGDEISEAWVFEDENAYDVNGGGPVIVDELRIGDFIAGRSGMVEVIDIQDDPENPDKLIVTRRSLVDGKVYVERVEPSATPGVGWARGKTLNGPVRRRSTLKGFSASEINSVMPKPEPTDPTPKTSEKEQPVKGEELNDAQVASVVSDAIETITSGSKSKKKVKEAIKDLNIDESIKSKVLDREGGSPLHLDVNGNPIKVGDRVRNVKNGRIGTVRSFIGEFGPRKYKNYLKVKFDDAEKRENASSNSLEIITPDDGDGILAPEPTPTESRQLPEQPMNMGMALPESGSDMYSMAPLSEEESAVPNALPEDNYEYAGEKFPPTGEQRNVITAIMTGDDVVVRALAGTGKTSTLTLAARRLLAEQPNKKIIYVAFNKTVQMEAEGKMPKNVESRTGDSIAFQGVSNDIRQKFLNQKSKSAEMVLRAEDISSELGIKPTGVKLKGVEVNLSTREIPAYIKQAVNNFAISADEVLGSKHFSEDLDEVPRSFVEYANAYWDDLMSPNGVFGINNAHITKIWALSNPDLGSDGSGLKTPANVIFFDEAQDINPVIAKVIADQKIQKVYVGDGNQAIYAFRGAEDQLDKTTAKWDLPLTQSFRFGPQIAGMANRFLAQLDSKYRVEGAGPAGEVVEGMEDPDVVITRTNSGGFRAMIELLEAGKTVGITKGTKDELESLVASAQWLITSPANREKFRKPTMHPDLAEFQNWEEVKEAVEKGEARKVKALYDLVVQNGIGPIKDILGRVQVITPESEKKDLKPSSDFKKVTLDQAEDGAKGSIGNGINYEIKGNAIRLSGNGTFKGKDTIKAQQFRWDKDGKQWFREVEDDLDRQKAINDLRRAIGGFAPDAGEEADEIDVVVTTAHKSKGLQWDNVRIFDDFWGPRTNKKTGELEMPADEELRLAYVALTRAQKKLDPGPLNWIKNYTEDEDELPKKPTAAEQDMGMALPTESVTEDEFNESTVKAAEKIDPAAEQVANAIIEALESGVAPWRKPWTGGGFLPTSVATGKSYEGSNILVLWAAMQKNGWTDNRFLTYKQAEKLGGNIKRGEKSTKVIHWQPTFKEVEKPDGTKEKVFVYRPPKVISLFNVEQAENLDLPPLVKGEPVAVTDAELSILDAYKDRPQVVNVAQDQAFYSPIEDIIKLPQREQFSDPKDYFETLVHELAHSTGHRSRLDRSDLLDNYGTHKASRGEEELIAEIAVSIAAARLGVEIDFGNVASYAQSWLQALKNDKSMIVKAAKAAQKAVDYMLGKQETPDEESPEGPVDEEGNPIGRGVGSEGRTGEEIAKEAPTTGTTEGYRGFHSAPTRENDAPLSDLTANAIYPEDVYSKKGEQIYGTGHRTGLDAEAHKLITSMRGKPDETVTVYRSVPSNVEGKINPGDWVTPFKKYAEEHGESNLNNDYKIVSLDVKAGDIFTEGNSWLEWGYDPAKTSEPNVGTEGSTGEEIAVETGVSSIKGEYQKGIPNSGSLKNGMNYQIEMYEDRLTSGRTDGSIYGIRRMVVSGNTYPNRQELKDAGFVYDKDTKTWRKRYLNKVFKVDAITQELLDNNPDIYLTEDIKRFSEAPSNDERTV